VLGVIRPLVCAKLVCAYKGERVNAVALVLGTGSKLHPRCWLRVNRYANQALCFAPGFVVTFDLQLLYPADSHIWVTRAAQNLICQRGLQLFANNRKSKTNTDIDCDKFHQTVINLINFRIRLCNWIGSSSIFGKSHFEHHRPCQSPTTLSKKSDWSVLMLKSIIDPQKQSDWWPWERSFRIPLPASHVCHCAILSNERL
jgi:hypothetical protein